MMNRFRSSSALVFFALLATACSSREPSAAAPAESTKKAAAALVAPTHPAARTGMSLAAGRNGLVLFGGCNTADNAACSSSNLQDQTWVFGEAGWRLRSPAHAPPARTGAVFVEDAERHVFVLFGGAGYEADGVTPKYFDDTWEWDGTDWTAKAGVSPGARTSAIATFDASAHAVVLHGGVGRGGSGAFAYDDLWSWDGTDWTSIAASTGSGSRRSDGALGRAATAGHYLRWGDSVVPGDSQPGFAEWDGSNWNAISEVSRPAAIPFDGSSNFVYGGGFAFFGGIVIGTGRVASLTSANPDPSGSNMTWFDVPIGGGLARSAHASAFDVAANRFYVYGGTLDSGATDDLSYFDQDGWHVAHAACASTSDCSAFGDYACNAGNCVAVAPQGGACSLDVQCATGHCADGVCCNSACQGRCEACNESGSVGECSAVTGAPVGDRAACATDGSNCGGSCDGVVRDACSYPTTQCRSATCASGVSHPEAACDGAGHCPAATNASCGTYACGDSSCKGECTEDADCAAGSVCLDGACGTKASTLACDDDGQCGSGHCVDGVCCDSACTGQCEACNVEGKIGQCSPVVGAPSGARAACETDGTKCGGSCDGVERATCSFPTASCRDAACAGDDFASGATCDGAGHCPAFTKTSCHGFVCRDAACVVTCTSRNDCVAGYTCDAGTCKALDPTDGDEALGTYDPDASATDGTTTGADAGANTDPSTPSSSADGSCSTSGPGGTHGARTTSLLGILVGVALLRRRRASESTSSN